MNLVFEEYLSLMEAAFKDDFYLTCNGRDLSQVQE